MAAGTWPAWILLKGNVEDDPEWGFAVQSEVGPDGKEIYGAIFRHAIRAVRAEEVEPCETRSRTTGPGRSNR